MQQLLGRFSQPFYALLRIVSGLLFAFHGAQKLLGFPGGGPGVPIASFIGIAGIIELVCGLLIALGLFTSIAAFIASGEMAVAYFKAHFPQAFWPIQNKGELAIVYCFLFLYIAAVGSGMWGIDSAARRPRRL